MITTRRTVAERGPLMWAFPVAENMPPDIQMMGLLVAVWKRFEEQTTENERVAATNWFNAWSQSQIEKAKK